MVNAGSVSKQAFISDCKLTSYLTLSAAVEEGKQMADFVFGCLIGNHLEAFWEACTARVDVLL